jgi:hypothetical protein
MFLQAFLEKLLGDDTGLWLAIHPLLYFAVDIAIGGGFIPEVVVLDDIVWHVCNVQLNLFVPGYYWGSQVEILDVHCHDFAPAVEMMLLMWNLNGK